MQHRYHTTWKSHGGFQGITWECHHVIQLTSELYTGHLCIQAYGGCMNVIMCSGSHHICIKAVKSAFQESINASFLYCTQCKTFYHVESHMEAV